MPAPFTVVTFTDEDKDEFPVRIQGIPTDPADAVAEATRKLELYCAQENISPRGKITSTNVEYFG